MAQTIDAMLADVTFTAPISVEDCQMVYAAIKEVLPESKTEVYFQCGDEVIIRVDNIVRKVPVS